MIYKVLLAKNVFQKRLVFFFFQHRKSAETYLEPSGAYIYDGAFLRKQLTTFSGFLAVNYFHKKAPFEWVLNTSVKSVNKNSEIVN